MDKQARVTSKEQITPKVWKLRLKMIQPALIDFKAGQFVSLKVADMRRRSYSIATSPVETEYIDLYNDVTPGGPGSEYFLNVKEGQIAEFIGPLGQFFYKEGRKIPAVFIATGTGIVPFLAMISYALQTEGTKRKIYLYYGQRHKKDAFFHDEFEKLQKHYTNFYYMLSLSRADEKWKGGKGYVTEFIERDFKHMKNIEAYVCGSQAMISSTEELLLKKGMDADNIYYEKFY